MWLPLVSRLSAPSRLALQSSRSISYKQKLYGNEEGHDKKNEVRKEKWIHKHKRRSCGGDYREGLLQKSRNPTSGGNTLVDLRDWSYPDGTPGPLSEGQERRVAQKKELIADILEAYTIVQEASKIPQS